MLLDRLEADLFQVVDGRAEPDSFGDRLRAGLELRRDVTPGRLVEVHGADHVTAEIERLHLGQELVASPQRPDARRAAHLVGREGEEVAPERLDVDPAMRCRLRGVDHHHGPLLVRPRRQTLDRVYRAERIRDVVRGDDFHVAVSRDLVETIEVQLPCVSQPDRPEPGAGALGDVLPGNEVRVVLELGDDDEVTRAKRGQSPRVRDEVDRLRRIPCEDDLARLRGVDERGDLLPSALVALGGALRERVDAPVHVAVRGLVEGPDRIEDLARLLGADRGVEVGERLAVDLLLENREVAAQFAGIELRLSLNGHVPMVLPGSRREPRSPSPSSGPTIRAPH